MSSASMADVCFHPWKNQHSKLCKGIKGVLMGHSQHV